MTFVLRPQGPFSLAAAAAFAEGFPGTQAERAQRGLRFAWAVDDDWRTVAVTLHQADATVRGELEGTPPADLSRRARRDVEQILSLDIDGRGSRRWATAMRWWRSCSVASGACARCCSSRPTRPPPGR